MFKEPVFEYELYHKWLQERASEYSTMKQSRFVTISREYGCGAYPVAVKLAQMLNGQEGEMIWLVFSHPIMETLISGEQLGVELIDRISEKRYSFMNWFIDGLAPDYLKSTQSHVFERMKTLILNLAEKGNCIIVGGGAQIITQRLDPAKFHATHIRIIGPYEFRLRQIMSTFGLDREEAENQLRSKQFARNKFVEDFTGQSAADNLLYHFIANNGKCPPDVIANTIFSCLDKQYRHGGPDGHEH